MVVDDLGFGFRRGFGCCGGLCGSGISSSLGGESLLDKVRFEAAGEFVRVERFALLGFARGVGGGWFKFGFRGLFAGVVEGVGH